MPAAKRWSPTTYAIQHCRAKTHGAQDMRPGTPHWRESCTARLDALQTENLIYARFLPEYLCEWLLQCYYPTRIVWRRSVCDVKLNIGPRSRNDFDVQAMRRG